jgi:hypothetical protein
MWVRNTAPPDLNLVQAISVDPGLPAAPRGHALPLVYLACLVMVILWYGKWELAPVDLITSFFLNPGTLAPPAGDALWTTGRALCSLLLRA